MSTVDGSRSNEFDCDVGPFQASFFFFFSVCPFSSGFWPAVGGGRRSATVVTNKVHVSIRR